MDNKIKKEVIYTLPYETEKDIKYAQEFRQDLYDKFNSVMVTPNGLYEVRIICEEDRTPIADEDYKSE